MLKFIRPAGEPTRIIEMTTQTSLERFSHIIKGNPERGWKFGRSGCQHVIDFTTKPRPNF